jgi:hypothetical protein
MGNLLRRTSTIRPEGTKSKWRRGKQKRVQTMEISNEGDQILLQNEQDQNNLNNKREDWDKRMNQQQLSNINGLILIIFI